MTAIPPTLLSTVRMAYESGTPLVLLFDYDGTLVPIVDHPRLARLSCQTRATLEGLACLPGVHLGVVSGRQHSDLKEMLAIPGLFLAGTAGLELDFRGITVTHPKVGNALPLLEDVAVNLHQLAEQFPGAWIEKRVGITLHFRHVAGRNVEKLCCQAQGILARYAGRLSVVDGPMALEITPNLGWTKGTAVRMFLENLPIRSRLVLYAGDGPNDLEAIQAVADLGGVTIGVGADAPSVAEVHVPSSQILGHWLHRLRLLLLRVAAGQTCLEQSAMSHPFEAPD